MKSKSTLGGSFAVRACVALMASGLAMTFAAAAQAVLQVPTSTRVAGSTVSGYNQDFGPAISTDLSNPTYTVFDAAGNQYVSDTGNNCVRKISASTGDTSVLVGYEATASSSDTCNTSSVTNISPTQGVVAPKGLALDSTGDLFIADSGHNCIRELVANTTGSKSLQAVVDTCTNYAPVGLSTNSVSPSPTGLIIDYEGDIIASIADSADNINQVIFHGVGNPKTEVCDLAGQTSAAVFNACPFFNGLTYVLNSPNGLAIDQAGNYYLADTGNSCVRELSATNVVTTPIGVCASDGSGTTAIPNFSPVGLAVGNQGYLYVSNANQATVLQYTGGSAAPWIFAGIPGAQTTVYTGAQEGIAGVDVSLNSPTGLSVDASGNIYVADSGNGIVRQLALNAQFSSENLKNASTAQTLQFEISSAVNLTATPGLDFQISNGNNTCTGSLTASATTTPTTCEVSLFFDPTYPGLRRSPLTLFDTISNKSFAFGLSGIGEGANALFIPGTINTLASGLGNPSAVVNSTTGNTYFAESGATLGAGDIKFIPSGTSTVITLVPPYGLIEDPVALVLDSAQNLYVADSAANSIFKVDANGHVTTFASGLSDPVAVAVDSVGNVYVAQDGAGADDVLKIYAGGQQVVIAGLGNNAAPNGVAAAQAQFVQPSGLYLDANNVLYVSDAGAYRVYDIDTTGIIHFFAGNGTQTSTNPLVPTGVGLQGPSGLVGDAAGDVYIADGPANLLYVVFGGSNQNPGIQALVGTGAAGNSGDAAAANLAQLNNPVSVALDGLDDLYLVDAGNSSVREVNYQQPILNFGNVKPGTTSAPLMTTLWDSGNSNLTSLTQFLPQNTADFAQVSSGCGGTLQQGSTCNLTYDFTPPTYGTYQTTATSNASAVNPQQIVTLMGASPQPTLSVPNATAVYGTAYTLSASITSSGTAPTGTITFAITLPAGNAQTLCNNVPVAANGTATCSPSPTLLDVIAGGYTFAAEYSGDTNYLPLTQTATLIITPAPVTITADNFTRPYNTPNPTFTGTITGVVAGQSITDTYTTSATQLSAPGTYPIAPGNPPTAGPGTLLSDYTITVVNGTLTITQNSGSVSINSPAVTSVYGTAYTLMSTISSTSAPTPTGTASFSIGAVTLCSNVPLTGGVVSCSPSPTLENVGSYTVTVSYSGDTFYPAATSSINLTITPAPVTITANNTSRQYDTPNPTFTGTITGVAAGQSITDTYSTSAVLLSPPGNYPISPTNPPTAGPGTLLSNYIIIVINGTLTITQDTTGLIFNTPAVTAVYGNAYTLTASITSSQTPAPTGTVTFSIAGQPICATATLVAGTATCTPSPTLENAGAYTVTVAYSGDTYYLAATSDLSLTVMPAPVTITAANASRPYDTANPTFTGTVVPQYPFPGAQSITATYATTAVLLSPPSPPTYPITPTAVAGAGTLLTNYNITLVSGALTITQNSGAVTINSPAVNAVYGSAYTLAASITSTGSPAPTGTATFTIGGQPICATATLSPSGAVTCSPSPTLENVGTYTVTVTYSGNAFYPSATSTIALTITPAPVTITAANASRPFDTPNPTFTGVITGVAAGQSITDAYTTTATQTSVPGIYPIAPGNPPVAGSGTLLSNYTITVVNGTLTITQLSNITFSTPAVTAVYGTAYTLAGSITSSQSPVPTGTATFTIGGQPVCPTATLASGAATCEPSPTLENVGAYTVVVTYSGDTNYQGSTSNLALTIKPAPVTITAASFTRAFDTANPTFTGTITGVVTGQSITATYTTTATETSAVGTYPITPVAAAGTGTLLTNYDITLVDGVLTIVQTMPTGNFSLSATPPEQEIDLEGTVQFPITVTSLQGFTDKVSLTCSGLPEGATCSFAPGTISPTANATGTSVMTITGSADNTNVPPGSFGALLAVPANPGYPPSSIVFAWTLMPIGFSGSAASILMGRKRRNRRSKGATRLTLWLVPLFLILAGLAGCGAPNNYKIYTVTVTATDSTYAVPVSQSTTVQLVLAR